MKRLSLLACVLILFFSVSAAMEMNFGMKFGMTLGNTAFDPEITESESGWDDEILFGLTEGLIIWFPLGDKTDIQTELALVQKGDKYGESDYDVAIKVNYLSLPILFRYHLNDLFTVYGGPGINYMLSGMFKYYDDDVAEMYYLEDDLNSIEIDLNAGMQYHITPKFFTDIRYSYGITDPLSDDSSIFEGEVEANSSTISLTAGYAF